MTEEQAEKSERKNIILQALGPDPRCGWTSPSSSSAAATS